MGPYNWKSWSWCDAGKALQLKVYFYLFTFSSRKRQQTQNFQHFNLFSYKVPSCCGTLFDVTQNCGHSNIKSYCFFRNSIFRFEIFNKQMKQKGKHSFHKYIKRNVCWFHLLCFPTLSLPAGTYMFKVNHKDSRTRCKICSKYNKKILIFIQTSSQFGFL